MKQSVCFSNFKSKAKQTNKLESTDLAFPLGYQDAGSVLGPSVLSSSMDTQSLPRPGLKPLHRSEVPSQIVRVACKDTKSPAEVYAGPNPAGAPSRKNEGSLFAVF